jgi:hypothetical protein
MSDLRIAYMPTGIGHRGGDHAAGVARDTFVRHLAELGLANLMVKSEERLHLLSLD